jgi:hypothetical protein
MNTNAENKDEFALSLIVGTAIGSFCTLLGPVGAIAGFVAGAGLGFWLDRKPERLARSKDTIPLENSAKKSICH